MQISLPRLMNCTETRRLCLPKEDRGMLTRRMSRFTIVFGLALIGVLTSSSTTTAAVTVPGDKTIETVDFERHVMGLFGRQGCNAGSCHGSFQGKGGFRLSLFAYEPKIDYYNIK